VTQQRTLYPPIEPYRTGTLKVSEIHTMFYQEAGNPEGKPALFLHGGPGVGILPDYRRFFDPQFYRVILPDQRGAARSTPFAELRENTTWDIVEDLEKLRKHLNVDRWVVMGGSWGSTLGLSYAVTYPNSIAALILRGIFLARRFEEDWLFRAGGTSQIFPDEWEKFLDPIPEKERGNLVSAYYNILTGENEEEKLRAARAWTRWEASTMTLAPNPKIIAAMMEPESAVAISRIECHYSFHNFFMKPENYLLEQVHKIREIPCRIVQGRHDVICPPISAWDLHKALPGSDLRIVPDGAHSPMDQGMIHELVQASEDFKELEPA
jgi:proline iminopeptidase